MSPASFHCSTVRNLPGIPVRGPSRAGVSQTVEGRRSGALGPSKFLPSYQCFSQMTIRPPIGSWPCSVRHPQGHTTTFPLTQASNGLLVVIVKSFVRPFVGLGYGLFQQLADRVHRGTSMPELGHSIGTTFLGFRGFTVQCPGLLDGAGM